VRSDVSADRESVMDKSSSGECQHSSIEHLGTDHGTRFARCQGCGRVFVFAGGRTWALEAPARPAQNGGSQPGTR
jgi:hypothetical protein